MATPRSTFGAAAVPMFPIHMSLMGCPSRSSLMSFQIQVPPVKVVLYTREPAEA